MGRIIAIAKSKGGVGKNNNSYKFVGVSSEAGQKYF